MDKCWRKARHSKVFGRKGESPARLVSSFSGGDFVFLKGVEQEARACLGWSLPTILMCSILSNGPSLVQEANRMANNAQRHRKAVFPIV